MKISIKIRDIWKCWPVYICEIGLKLIPQEWWKTSVLDQSEHKRSLIIRLNGSAHSAVPLKVDFQEQFSIIQSCDFQEQIRTGSSSEQNQIKTTDYTFIFVTRKPVIEEIKSEKGLFIDSWRELRLFLLSHSLKNIMRISSINEWATNWSNWKKVLTFSKHPDRWV